MFPNKYNNISQLNIILIKWAIVLESFVQIFGL
jgi:hypothetical protein